MSELTRERIKALLNENSHARLHELMSPSLVYDEFDELCRLALRALDAEQIAGELYASARCSRKHADDHENWCDTGDQRGPCNCGLAALAAWQAFAKGK